MVVAVTEINTIGVIGFGTMGEGIVQNFAEAGFLVRAIDQDPETLDRGLKQIKANLETAEAHNILVESPSSIVARIECFAWTELDVALANVQMIVETVPEVLSMKQDVFNRIDPLSPDILFASNTSSFTVSEITQDMKSPERVVGMHYFNPAHLIPAIEIHKSDNTSEEAIATAIAVTKKSGKVPVLVRKEVPGFVINRLTGAIEREIDFLLDNGVVTPEDLDEAIKASFGFRLACIGPMEAEDFIGLDTAYRVSNIVFKDLSNAQESSPGLAEKVERGELGVKSGKGWYDYSGKDRSEILQERDEKLIRQLDLFRKNN